MEENLREQLVSVFEKKDVSYINGGIEKISKILDTDLQKGLTKKQLNDPKRKQFYGINKLPERPPKSFFAYFFDALEDTTIIILIVAAVVSIILGVAVEKESGGWIEGTAILFAVVIVGFVIAGNEFSKEKQFRKLARVSNDILIKVIRGGQQIAVSTFDIVVGDIVYLEAGDKICADGIIIDHDDMKCDESQMTGETDAIKKGPNSPYLLCGCQVLDGRGTMLVAAVGPHTQWGRIKALVMKEGEDTPLQIHLEELAESIGKMGLVAAAFTFITLFVKWIVPLLGNPNHSFGWQDIDEPVDFLLTAITIVAVAVPEGLPLAVTISLAYSMFKMMKDNNLVRHLEACETMGGATNICSDKTGTLTENRMTVVEAIVGDKYFSNLERENVNLNEKVADLFAKSVSLCSTAFWTLDEQNLRRYVGSKTECALLEFIEKSKYEFSEIRSSNPIKKMFPFNSTKKKMTALSAGESGRVLIWSKGAPENMITFCNQYVDENNQTQKLDNEKSEQLLKQVEKMATKGLRTIAIAYKSVEEPSDWETFKEPSTGFTLIGICGIKDPVRKDVPGAVATCQRAGIYVRMLTGDNILTANHIAKECGILKEGGVSMEGPEFRKLSDKQLDEIIPKLQVLARCSPQDKYRLVHRLKFLGEVVAVTGDGTNDAPSLAEADVGFSMGIVGTEVAKEASDIVLLDDSFNSIVAAVMWGRNVYDSIRKFVQFQVTVNIVAVTLAFIGAVSYGESPLTPIQMLWVNLIMDTMAALALATESPHKSLLDRKPYGRHENILTPAMWRNILGQAICQLIIMFFLMYLPHRIPYFGLPPPGSWTTFQTDLHQTLIFNTFVWCQIFNEFNARKLGNELNVFVGLFGNTIFVGVLIFTVTVQILIVQFAGRFASCVPLSFTQWVACVFIGSSSVPVGFLLRLIPISTIGKNDKPKDGLEAFDIKDSIVSVRNASRQIIIAQRILQNLNKIQNDQLKKYDVLPVDESFDTTESKKDK
eukprot:TRINITY_DN505_c0_g1_i1.p1 TRINITY_DN505_c0_g1~~TRINITY_DN505_c0_g1_i1.p1  ORF type:complete len:1009 (-),score=313.19 TRINITY_DN505_c0_g1_i1:89-3070(-)